MIATGRQLRASVGALLTASALTGCPGPGAPPDAATDAGDKSKHAAQAGGREGSAQAQGAAAWVHVAPGFSLLTRDGVLRPDREAAAWGGGCVGHVAAEPSWQVLVDAPVEVTLLGRPVGNSLLDLTLAVRGPDGAWRCSDDGEGMNPQVTGTWAPGRWQVFVGVQGQDPAPAYRLLLHAGPPSAAPPALRATLPPPILEGPLPLPLPPGPDGTAGGLELAEGTGPGRLSGTAGGKRDARDVDAACAGFVADAPDHRLRVTAPMELTLRVESDADTSLMLQGPRERFWCDDDTEGLQPAIRAVLDPGDYSVFVGAHDETSAPAYLLTVSR